MLPPPHHLLGRLPAAATIALVFLAPVAARAQTGAELLLAPWWPVTTGEESRDAWMQIDTSYQLQFNSQLSETDEGFDLWRFESGGRFRPDPLFGAGVTLGFDVLHIDTDSEDTAIPHQLVDYAMAVGYETPLVDHGDEGRFGIVGGVGYAGDSPFSDGDAIYLQGDLFYERPLDDKSTLTFVLNYDGNRSLWPDIPLPSIAYTRRQSDRLVYVIGLPYSSLFWRPQEQVVVRASYSVPYSLDVTAEYYLSRSIGLFVSFDSQFDAFHIDDPGIVEEEHDRLFFSQRRVELGLRLRPQNPDVSELVVALGYAFDQSFETGWDARDLETLREPEAAVYGRVGVNLRF